MASAVLDYSTALQNLILTNVTSPNEEPLGRGAYGVVFTVEHHGKVYAAKELHQLLVQYASKEEKEVLKGNFLRECYNCSILSHPNIVRFIGIYYPHTHSFLPVMVMELMRASLTKYMEKPKTIETKAAILYDVSIALEYLHSRCPPIVHRDLSPNNILMSHDLVAKITDLGVAKAIKAEGTQSMHTKVPGTVDFMPPESFEENPKYDTSMDVFSIGGVTLFVVNQKWPRAAPQVRRDPITGERSLVDEVQRRQTHLNEMKGGSEALKKLVIQCLNDNPDKRPKTCALVKLMEILKKQYSHPPVPPRDRKHSASLPPQNDVEEISTNSNAPQISPPPLVTSSPEDSESQPPLPPRTYMAKTPIQASLSASSLPPKLPAPPLPPKFPSRQKRTANKTGSNGDYTNSLIAFPWYHGDIDRDTSESFLAREATDGCFIVRDPSRVEQKELGYYSLSVWYGGRTQHVRIRQRVDKKYAVGTNEKPFVSVEDLVEHYEKVPLQLQSVGTILLTYTPKL